MDILYFLELEKKYNNDNEKKAKPVSKSIDDVSYNPVNELIRKQINMSDILSPFIDLFIRITDAKINNKLIIFATFSQLFSPKI